MFVGSNFQNKPLKCIVEDSGKSVSVSRQAFLERNALEESLGLKLGEIDGLCQRQWLTEFDTVFEQR